MAIIRRRDCSSNAIFLKISTILEFELPLPSYNEQSIIATILSDNEIQTFGENLPVHARHDAIITHGQHTLAN